jgi:flagellar basal body rod protein FlgF
MQIDVIGNNLANSNTPGYKADNMYFSSLLTQSLATGANSLNIGQGVRVSSVSTQFAAGAMQTTKRWTSIDGDGFFAVKDARGGFFACRRLHTDKNNLVDANGIRPGLQPDQNTVTGIGQDIISGLPPISSRPVSIWIRTRWRGPWYFSGPLRLLGGVHSVSIIFKTEHWDTGVGVKTRYE